MCDPRPDRLSCSVPFCRRTVPRERSREWVCQKHWPAVPRALRHDLSVAKKRMKGAWTDDDLAVVTAAWERCRSAAIEAAAGI